MQESMLLQKKYMRSASETQKIWSDCLKWRALWPYIILHYQSNKTSLQMVR